jgi:hypothetical protein
MPLPGRIEIRDLDDAAQVAGPVGIAARLAVPVVLPVRRLQVLNHGVAAARDGLKQPRFPPLAVETLERDDVAADLVHQVGQQ